MSGNISKLKPPTASATAAASKVQPSANTRSNALTTEKMASLRAAAFEKVKALEREEKASKSELQEKRASGTVAATRLSGIRKPLASAAGAEPSRPFATSRTGIPTLRGGKSVAALRLSAENSMSVRSEVSDSISPNSSFISEPAPSGKVWNPQPFLRFLC